MCPTCMWILLWRSTGASEKPEGHKRGGFPVGFPVLVVFFPYFVGCFLLFVVFFVCGTIWSKSTLIITIDLKPINLCGFTCFNYI